MEIPQILKPYEDYLKSTLKPTNRIIFSVEETKPWESKLGGCPYLENIEEYPKGANGQPMMFLAQINLEEMPPLPDFPENGLLQFYVEATELYGLDEACFVKYVPDYKTDEAALVSTNPYRSSYEEFEPFSQDCKMSFVQEEMFIETNCQEFEDRFGEVSEEENDALFDLCGGGDSRVGGYPYFVQQAPSYYDDGTASVLLLQLDIDDTSGLMFGDSGNCTFWFPVRSLWKGTFLLWNMTGNAVEE